jgi:hypothetical protein
VGISFHAVKVFGLGMTLLFKSVLGHCGGDLEFFFLQLAYRVSSYVTRILYWLEFSEDHLVWLKKNTRRTYSFHALTIWCREFLHAMLLSEMALRYL